MGLNVADIITEFGAHYANEGQNLENITSTMLEKRAFNTIARTLVHDGDVFKMANGVQSDVVQGFKSKWSPKGDTTFKPNPIDLRRQKINISIFPDDIAQTFLGFLADLKAGDRTAWPVVRWIWEKYVVPKWSANMSHIDWAGQYVAPTNDTVAGPTLGSYDGIKYIVNQGLTAGTMHRLECSTDIASTSGVFDGIEQIAEQLPSEWEGEDVVFLVAPRTELRYFKDKRNQHGSDTANQKKGDYKTIDGRETWGLVPFHGMGKSNDYGWVVATLRENLIRVVRNTGYAYDMQKDKYEVILMADWQEGIGFANADEVWAFDPSYTESSD